MIGAGGRVFPGLKKKTNFILVTHKWISTYMNTKGLNIFHNHSGIYRSVRKNDKIYGGIKAQWDL